MRMQCRAIAYRACDRWSSANATSARWRPSTIGPAGSNLGTRGGKASKSWMALRNCGRLMTWWATRCASQSGAWDWWAGHARASTRLWHLQEPRGWGQRSRWWCRCKLIQSYRPDNGIHARVLAPFASGCTTWEGVVPHQFIHFSSSIFFGSAGSSVIA
jgi:hypothetical protein